MDREMTPPVHWRGRHWAVTGHGIEATDGLYLVPASDLWPEGALPPEWLVALRRRYGTDYDDLDEAVRVARIVFAPGAGTP
ncbi:hypothetical protein [Methylorubrum salsuginis]|uniref:Uncharacterized protein n=1 Tax=Methylorubrum salsuginis TaxID=414703 RepID=A0A1I4DBN3_9HYPH|nr:hypothetical protein [Methylorubrum salsuginis]SFK89536.1 hypothetical protein SAMN04488125_105236 [Methylorubrum salsuginis]